MSKPFIRDDRIHVGEAIERIGRHEFDARWTGFERYKSPEFESKFGKWSYYDFWCSTDFAAELKWLEDRHCFDEDKEYQKVIDNGVMRKEWRRNYRAAALSAADPPPDWHSVVARRRKLIKLIEDSDHRVDVAIAKLRNILCRDPEMFTLLQVDSGHKQKFDEDHWESAIAEDYLSVRNGLYFVLNPTASYGLRKDCLPLIDEASLEKELKPTTENESIGRGRKGTILAQTKTFDYLCNLMIGPKSETKKNLEPYCMNNFNVSRKGFLTAWDRAVAEVENAAWSQPGPLKGKN